MVRAVQCCPIMSPSHKVGTLFAFDPMSSFNAKGAHDVAIFKSI
jgi:hypothetical protein